MSWDFDKKVRKKRRWGKVFEYTSYQRKIPQGEELQELRTKIEQEIKKARIFTPQELAVKHDVRVSVIKSIIDEFVEKGTVKPYVGKGKQKTYVPAN